jgi:hypothetical protein
MCCLDRVGASQLAPAARIGLECVARRRSRSVRHPERDRRHQPERAFYFDETGANLL